MGLTLAEGQKQECLKEQQIIFLLVHENLVNPLFSSHTGILSHCSSLYVYITISML
jgi:hypothetical protein